MRISEAELSSSSRPMQRRTLWTRQPHLAVFTRAVISGEVRGTSFAVDKTRALKDPAILSALCGDNSDPSVGGSCLEMLFAQT